MKKIILSLLVCFPLFARAEVVVVVSADSKIGEMEKSSVEQIFTGLRRAVDGQELAPLDLPHEDPAREAFYQALFGKDRDQMKAMWARLIFTGKARPPLEMNSSEEMIHQLKSTPGFIGYIDSTDMKPGLKVIYTLAP